MEYRSVTTGEPTYFAWDSAYGKRRRQPHLRFKEVLDLYREKYGVPARLALVNAGEVAEITTGLRSNQTVQVVGRHHIPRGVFFLELPLECP